MPSTLVLSETFLSPVACEPSMTLSPLRVRSTSEPCRTSRPALFLLVWLMVVSSRVRSTLVSLFSSVSSRFLPMSMPLPPVVRVESLTVRSTFAPSPTVTVDSPVLLVSAFTPSITISTSRPSEPSSLLLVFSTPSFTVTVFSVGVSLSSCLMMILPSSFLSSLT